LRPGFAHHRPSSGQRPEHDRGRGGPRPRSRHLSGAAASAWRRRAGVANRSLRESAAHCAVGVCPGPDRCSGENTDRCAARVHRYHRLAFSDRTQGWGAGVSGGPQELWRQIWSINPQDAWITTSSVAPTSSKSSPTIALSFAWSAPILAEQNDELQIARRYFIAESFGQAERSTDLRRCL